MKQITSNEEINRLNAENQMFLLYFSGEMCSVCHDLKPKVEEMLMNYSGIDVAQVDIKKAAAIAASFQIFTVPAVIFFIEGKETIRQAGVFSMTALEEKIARYYRLLNE
ncbi:thioredoxin family protein [Eubacteriaceae bacterium ES3]|nr:thioredoxin family protein [Eubacteriaceae bacterium ES3]